jgi:hypothetical protein
MVAPAHAKRRLWALNESTPSPCRHVCHPRGRDAVMFATRAGGTTIDQDAFGGNPFATALINLSTQGRVSFQQFPRRLRTLTIQGSQRHQVPEWSNWPERLTWHFSLPPGSRKERRCALVLMVSDYSGLGLPPLAGAAHDERRISEMFATNGFTVVQGVAADRSSIVQALTGFRRAARSHDVAIIYSTGHGLECGGQVYLLPGNYRWSDGYSPSRLRAHAVPVARIAAACQARRLNIAFFAGCRTLACNLLL